MDAAVSVSSSISTNRICVEAVHAKYMPRNTHLYQLYMYRTVEMPENSFISFLSVDHEGNSKKYPLYAVELISSNREYMAPAQCAVAQ